MMIGKSETEDVGPEDLLDSKRMDRCYNWAIQNNLDPHEVAEEDVPASFMPLEKVTQEQPYQIHLRADRYLEHAAINPGVMFDGREVADLLRGMKRVYAQVIHDVRVQGHEIEQTLGKALGYPWFKDDQKNFPGSTEADGVCVGDHVPESLAAEAATRIRSLEQQVERLSKIVCSLGGALC